MSREYETVLQQRRLYINLCAGNILMKLMQDAGCHHERENEKQKKKQKRPRKYCFSVSVSRLDGIFDVVYQREEINTNISAV